MQDTDILKTHGFLGQHVLIFTSQPAQVMGQTVRSLNNLVERLKRPSLGKVVLAGAVDESCSLTPLVFQGGSNDMIN